MLKSVGNSFKLFDWGRRRAGFSYETRIQYPKRYHLHNERIGNETHHHKQWHSFISIILFSSFGGKPFSLPSKAAKYDWRFGDPSLLWIKFWKKTFGKKLYLNPKRLFTVKNTHKYLYAEWDRHRIKREQRWQRRARVTTENMIPQKRIKFLNNNDNNNKTIKHEKLKF